MFEDGIFLQKLRSKSCYEGDQLVFVLKASKAKGFLELPTSLPGGGEKSVHLHPIQVTFHCGGFCQAEVGNTSGMGGWENGKQTY